MGVVVEFNYSNFVARYPEFATVNEATADAYFAEACIYHRNDGGGPVDDATIQSVLLNMMTAHIAARYATINGEVPSPLVGRINSGTEGSVSVGVEGFAGVTGSQQWLLQTKYGSDYWFATAPYRTMRYRVTPQRTFDAGFPGWSGADSTGTGF